MTKYEKIANDLVLRMTNNEFKDTSKLPTEDQLIDEYKVSRNTIRNAIKVLMRTGLIYPVQGSGMFIREQKKANTVFLNGTHGITKDFPGKTITTKCLTLQIINSDITLSELMNCEIDTPIYYIERLRLVDDIPYAIEYTYYNKNIIPYLNKDICESSIFNYIQNDLKLTFGFADKYLSASKLSKDESQLLQLNEGDPAFIIEDNIYLSNGTLFNSSHVIYNYKLAHFFMSVID